MPGRKTRKGGKKPVAKKPAAKKQTGGKKPSAKKQTGGKKPAAVADPAPAEPAVAPVAAAPVAVQAGGEAPAKPARKQRYFRLLIDGEARGRFSGLKPKQAASKALTSLLNSRTKDGLSTAGEHHYTMVECTRGCSGKKYRYVGERVELDEPVTVTLGNKDIVYRHSNVVRKDKSE